MITGLPRTTTRTQWKWLWRQFRITVREAMKAHTDMIVFGTGACLISEDEPDLIRHIPIAEFHDRMARA
jgi:hypothetical protein